MVGAVILGGGPQVVLSGRERSTSSRAITSHPARDRFARRTSSGDYLPELDGLRFVAIALVILFHVGVLIQLDRGMAVTGIPFGEAAEIGTSMDGADSLVSHLRIGVELFFAISGFVLAMPFIRSRVLREPSVPLDQYFLRRLTRIEPPYVAAMTILFVIGRVLSGAPSPKSLFSSLAYIHQPVFGSSYLADGVTWSLEIEVQWYLLVPLVALLITHRSAIVRRWTIGILVVVCWALEGHVGTTPMSLTLITNWLPFFLVGWLLADVALTDQRSRRQHSWPWDLACVLSLIAIIGPFGQWNTTSTLLIFLFFAAALRGKLSSRFLRIPWIATIGGMCYSIYLVHWPVLLLVRHLSVSFPELPYPAAFAYRAILVLPITALVAGTFYLVVEQPCMTPGWPGRAMERLRATFGVLRPTRLAPWASTTMSTSRNHADRTGVRATASPLVPPAET
jgi:peptidoglycan/LPS O-acetylase OafA/YrhL